MDKNISKRINFLRFFMVCFIVMYHAGTPKGTNCLIDQKFNLFVSDTFNNLAVMAMGCFFCISGFLLFYNLDKKTYKQKMVRRLKSLLIPYLVWQIIVIIKKIIMQEPLSIIKLIKTIFLFDRWPPDGPLWYLYVILILALMSIIIIPLLKHKKLFGIIIVFLILILHETQYIPGLSEITKYGYISNIISYLPSYIVGMFFGYYYSKESNVKPLLYTIPVLIVLIILDICHGIVFYSSIIKIFPIFMLYLFPVSSKNTDRLIYKLSFLMFCLHQIVSKYYINIASPLFFKLTDCAITYNIFGRMLFLCLSLLLAFIIYKLLKRFSPKTLNILIGYRA